jgi:hypothetical protein
MARRLVAPAACRLLIVGPMCVRRPGVGTLLQGRRKRSSGGLLFEALGNLRDGGAAATSRALD